MFNRPLCSKTFISDTKFGTLNRRTPNGFSGGVRGIMNEERNLSSFTYLIMEHRKRNGDMYDVKE